ncbi:hypothetical protein V1478_006721 [Vespula squamosa]|uniref:Uncharacterized protein n=1 Tax=Vespula squamosa TaxID=30214 RepID=A0ABD2B0P7_VESSQ
MQTFANDSVCGRTRANVYDPFCHRRSISCDYTLRDRRYRSENCTSLEWYEATVEIPMTSKQGAVRIVDILNVTSHVSNVARKPECVTCSAGTTSRFPME